MTYEILDRLHRQVRVDRGGSVANQQGDVVNLADVAAFYQQTHLRAPLVTHQVVVCRCSRQQRRDRAEFGVTVTVGQHDEFDPRSTKESIS